MGLTPEAIEHNPVIFELMLEMAWHHDPIDPDAWLAQYVTSRYGKNTPNTQV
jgi:alpha-N-acetylglucosaminidase